MCKGECRDHVELESKLSEAEAEANYWYEKYENEVFTSKHRYEYKRK